MWEIWSFSSGLCGVRDSFSPAAPLWPCTLDEKIGAMRWMQCYKQESYCRCQFRHCYPGTGNSNTVSGKDWLGRRLKNFLLLLMGFQKVEIKCNQDCNCQHETDPICSTNQLETTSHTSKVRGKQRERMILLLWCLTQNCATGRALQFWGGLATGQVKGERNVHVLIDTQERLAYRTRKEWVRSLLGAFCTN